MTVGEVEVDEQPLTALDHPGGDTPHPGDVLADGPFTTRQLLRLDDALRVAERETGLTFSVYIGELAAPARETAEALHRQVRDCDHAVLIAVAPGQRKLEIVTGNAVRRRISDRDAKLAGLSMAAAFAGGDLAGGIVAGLDQLASHAGRS